MFSQSSQKVTKYFGYFCKKLKNKNHQKVLKIAQSGHTAHDFNWKDALDVASHITSFKQLECFISAYHT